MRSRRAVTIVAIVAVALALLWLSRRGGRSESSATVAQHGSATTTSPVPHARTHAALAGRHVAGTVLLDGKAVADASVRIARIAGDAGRVPTVTDASGHFDLGAVPLGRYVVIADKRQTSGASMTVDLRDPDVKAEQLALVLHACTAVVHGSVRDAAGGAIGGARVARAMDALDGPSAETDAAGNYELCAVVEDTLLVASADGYAQDVAFVQISGQMRHDFLLGPEAEISGRVVRADDHTPVAGADVVVRPERPTEMFGLFTTASDSDGHFRVSGAGVGRYLVSATADGLATERAVPTLAEVGKAQDDLVCELARAIEVSGHVLDDGKPVGNVRVVLRGRREPGRESVPDAITAADGSFTIEHVPSGEYTAYVAGYTQASPAHITVETTDIADLRVEVEALATVSGRVTHEGKPVEGAQVSDGRARAITDVDGQYTLRGVAEGTHEIYAQSERIGSFAHGPKLTLARGEHKTGVDIELDLSGAISGTVVDQDGKPVDGVLVTFSLVHGRDYGKATTAEDGTFTASTLSGGGDYTYIVRASAGSEIRYEPLPSSAPPIHVADGHTRVTGVRIAIHRVATSVSGHVVGGHGEPLPDVIVRASYRAFGASVARTDETGAFTLTDVPETPFTLHASSVRGDAVVENVKPGQRDVVIHIADAGTITGTLDGFTDEPDVVAVNATGMLHADVHGHTFTIRGVSPGMYMVNAHSRTGSASARVTVAPGANATIELKARAYGTISGVVRDAKTHEPVPGLMCSAHGPGTSAHTDASGAFQIERVPAGDGYIVCGGANGIASKAVTVTEGQTTTVELLAQPADPSGIDSVFPRR